jgi:hypothetical protein
MRLRLVYMLGEFAVCDEDDLEKEVVIFRADEFSRARAESVRCFFKDNFTVQHQTWWMIVCCNVRLLQHNLSLVYTG